MNSEHFAHWVRTGRVPVATKNVTEDPLEVWINGQVERRKRYEQAVSEALSEGRTFKHLRRNGMECKVIR